MKDLGGSGLGSAQPAGTRVAPVSLFAVAWAVVQPGPLLAGRLSRALLWLCPRSRGSRRLLRP